MGIDYESYVGIGVFVNEHITEEKLIENRSHYVKIDGEYQKVYDMNGNVMEKSVTVTSWKFKDSVYSNLRDLEDGEFKPYGLKLVLLFDDLCKDDFIGVTKGEVCNIGGGIIDCDNIESEFKEVKHKLEIVGINEKPQLIHLLRVWC